MDQPHCPLGFLQVDRRHLELALQERMPLLDVRLVLVDQKDLLLGVAPLGQVRHQAEDPIGPVLFLGSTGFRVGKDQGLRSGRELPCGSSPGCGSPAPCT